MSSFKSLFAGEKINTGRQIELDIARALAVLFMIFVHVQMTFSNEKLTASFFGNIVDFMGGIPAAPVFMFLMGVGFLYTKKSSYKSFIKRGIYIFLLGYLLNLLREVIPELIDYITYGEKESLDFAIESLIDVDILQFAGLTMIFWGVIKKFRLNNMSIATLGILFPIINMFLLKIQFDNYYWQAISGLIWGSSKYSEFPFLTWITYPILGCFFAHLLISCNDKKQFYKTLIQFSAPSLLVTSFTFSRILGQELGFMTELDYYHHNIFTNIVYGLFCILWISLIYFSIKFIPRIIIDALKRWSKNVTDIYFVHWVIIGWLSWLFYEYSVSIIMYLILTICILMLSDIISVFLNSRNIGIK